MADGRSVKSVRNVTTGVANKVLLMVLAFATRTLFIRLLGAEYAGVSSLYTNILSVLSLAEMGMGNVLMFYLYGALKDGDTKRISGLVRAFQRIYFAIILIVLSVGLALIPFLRLIVHSPLDSGELIGYYLLYLINSVASYFVVYRTIVLAADQKNYISNLVHTAAVVVMYVLQIAYLLLFRDFWGYLIIQVLCTIGSNLVLNQIALKHYPYLRRRPSAAQTDAAVSKRDLFGNIKATFLFKIADTVLDQTDSIIISVMFGTVVVGYYANYFMLISYIVAIAGIIANGLVASFGNLNAEGDMERSYEMFRASLTAFSVFGTVCTTCYACVVQDFVPIWIGEQYVMPFGLVAAILAVFFLRMTTNTMWMYRSAMGLFKEVQYINLAAAGLNIVLSVLLGKALGVAGVIAATAVSRFLTSFWYEGRVVFRRFGKPLRIYLLLQLKSFCVCAAAVCGALWLCSFIGGGPIARLALKLLVSACAGALVSLAAYGRTAEMKTICRKLLAVLRRAKGGSN